MVLDPAVRWTAMRGFVLLLIGAGLCAADKRPVTPEDYFLFANVADPQISPDGKLVAYTVTRVDAEQNRRNSEVWLAAIDGSAPPPPPSPPAPRPSPPRRA